MKNSALLAILLTVSPLATAQGPSRAVTYHPTWKPPQRPALVEFIGQYNAKEAAAIAQAIYVSGKRHGIEPQLLAAVLHTESRFRPDVVSGAGAIGIAQLMPETAKELGVNPWQMQECIDGGAAYLAKMIRWKDGSIPAALAAYNAGPNCRELPAETRAYIEAVMKTAERLR